MAKKKDELIGAALQVRKHPYRGDGVRDHRGEDRCEDCGLAKGHRVHRLERVDPEVAQTTSRITGEREAGE